MATTTVHAQLIKYEANGNQKVLYLENKGEDVKISSSNNSNIPSGVTTVQGLVDALGVLAFSDGITVSNLTTGNFAAGVITTSLTTTEAGKIADARAISSLNDKIKLHSNSINAINTICTNLKDKAITTTLSASSWTGTSAPYSQNIDLGATYSARVFELVQSPDCTEEQFLAFCDMGGGIGTVSGQTLTIKIYGIKPTIDIPVVLIIRGDS